MRKTKKRIVRKRAARRVSVLRVREPVVEYKFKPAQSKPRLAAAQTVEHVTKGLPFKEVESLRGQLAEPLETLGRHLSISRSTLQRRRAERRLSPHESDRVARISRLLRHATAVFGDIDRARQWLKFPQSGLGGAVPLDYARTEVGAREVENLLGRIDYSVYS